MYIDHNYGGESVSVHIYIYINRLCLQDDVECVMWTQDITEPSNHSKAQILYSIYVSIDFAP